MGFSSEINVKWFFFATEHTQIDFRKLKQVLERYDPKKVAMFVVYVSMSCTTSVISSPMTV